MQLHDLSYVRSGDKGDVANVVVLARDEDAYAIIEDQLVPRNITEHLKGLVTGPIEVYPLPKIHAFQVVLYGALGGGATRTLRFDGTGKSMCTVLSRMPIGADSES